MLTILLQQVEKRQCLFYQLKNHAGLEKSMRLQLRFQVETAFILKLIFLFF